MRPIYDAKFRGEIRKRMSPPSRETVTEISRATGISRQTLYSWRHLWKREGELVPAAAMGIRVFRCQKLCETMRITAFNILH